jgi:hypothetical protein
MSAMAGHGTARPWGAYGDRTAARRAAARQHHPDAGGSAAALTAAFAEIDRAYGHVPDGHQDVTITIVHRGLDAQARALVVAGAMRGAMALNDIRTRVRRVAGAARSYLRGARRARSTSLEDQQ